MLALWKFGKLRWRKSDAFVGSSFPAIAEETLDLEQGKEKVRFIVCKVFSFLIKFLVRV